MINLIWKMRKIAQNKCAIKRTSIETLSIIKWLVYNDICIRENKYVHTTSHPSNCLSPVIGIHLRASVLRLKN